MPKTKLSKVAKDVNVSTNTLIDFLRKKGILEEAELNINTRVDDEVVTMLMQEFGAEEKPKPAPFNFKKPETHKEEPQRTEETEIKLDSETGPKPRILGKLELDANGNPVVKNPETQAAAKTESEPAVAKNETPVKDDIPVKEETPVKEEVNTKEEAHATPAQEQPQAARHEEVPAAETTKQQAPQAQSPVSKETVDTPAQETETVTSAEEKAPADTQSPTTADNDAKEEKEEEEEIFTTGTPKPTVNINIVGKIDLSAINSSTRPKKKSKEDRRSAAQGDANTDRKKRKRIGGKEKVDIEKTGRQAAQQSAQPSGRRQDERRGDNSPKNSGKNRRPAPAVHAEVSEEDVSKQVKETLARLTAKDKGLKKGLKWRKEKREAQAEREREAQQQEMAESRVLKLTEFVTANDLAVMMDVPINQVIATCMNIGVMVSINQRLDAETINIVAEEFGFRTEYISADVSHAIQQDEDKDEDLQSRPPIVTVMGHVDHGKTSLLDYIRNANVIAGEAGGITQHIGAYNVKLDDGRHITFLDTPGHEAFTAMRARGAKVTDLCIIIVAADDNVMPQTVEAINHAAAAGVPIVFAINKIDKPHANPEKIKEELAAMNYLVEDWGGKYQSQDISAKKGIGVNELMEKVLLEAELLDLKANPNRNATGSIIESSLDKGRGYVATVLVQNGTLRVGDVIVAGTHFGKVKAMFNERNQRIKEAGPATPALILGLNGAPTAGDTFNVLDTEQEAREIATKREQLQREQGMRTTKMVTLEDIGRRRAIGNFQELNIIVKGDVDGSIEALSDSLIKLSTEEIQVNVLHKAVGEISESDVTLAAASDAIIIGFQVRPSLAARRAAERDGVQIRLYSVIYQAIEEVKDAMSGMLAPEIKEEVIGTAEVRETYHISKVGTIAGAMVVEGRIRKGTKVRLIRDGIVRYTGELGSLKRFKDDAKEVIAGLDCGLSISGFNDIKVGDMVECFEEKEVSRTID